LIAISYFVGACALESEFDCVLVRNGLRNSKAQPGRRVLRSVAKQPVEHVALAVVDPRGRRAFPKRALS
jgi:hypothetical protein